MAKQMSFTSNFGVTFSQSYWLPAQINLNKVDSTGLVVFLGYATAAAREAMATPVGQKEYAIAPDTYAAYFSAGVLSAPNVNELSQAYALAMATLESGTNLSFFNTATDV